MAKEKAEQPTEEKKEPGEEAENAEGGDSGLEPPKKKLSKKLIILIVVGGLIFVGGGVGAALYFSGVFKSAPAEKDKTENASPADSGADANNKEKTGEKEGKPAFFSLGDLLVNLSGQGKRPNYLRVKIQLELADEKDSAAVEALKPRIVDDFQMYLRELRIEDLQGAAGLYRLREALLLRVTEIAHPTRIRDVLFQEMLVQ